MAAPDVERLVLDAVVAAGARKAIFSRSDLLAEVAARIPSGSAVNAVTVLDWAERLTDRALHTSEAVELVPEHDGPDRASDARYASATTLYQELEILQFADSGIGAGVATCRAPVVAETCARRGLDETQTAAVARIVLGGDQVSVLVAPAGTGKTTTLAAIVPFTSRFEPVWVGLGALALDLVLGMVVTSLVRDRIGRRVWRAVHLLAYAAFSHSPPSTGSALQRTCSPARAPSRARPANRCRMTERLQLHPTRCDGHDGCAELLPELVHLDEWGYPVLAQPPDQAGTPVPAAPHRDARRAVTLCPTLALRLVSHVAPSSG